MHSPGLTVCHAFLKLRYEISRGENPLRGLSARFAATCGTRSANSYVKDL